MMAHRVDPAFRAASWIHLLCTVTHRLLAHRPSLFTRTRTAAIYPGATVLHPCPLYQAWGGAGCPGGAGAGVPPRGVGTLRRGVAGVPLLALVLVHTGVCTVQRVVVGVEPRPAGAVVPTNHVHAHRVRTTRVLSPALVHVVLAVGPGVAGTTLTLVRTSAPSTVITTNITHSWKILTY